MGYVDIAVELNSRHFCSNLGWAIGCPDEVFVVFFGSSRKSHVSTSNMPRPICIPSTGQFTIHSPLPFDADQDAAGVISHILGERSAG